MKQVVFLIVFLFTLSAYGEVQTDTTTLKKSGRVQVGVTVSPDYCYRMSKNGASQTAYSFLNKYIKDKPGFGNTASLNFRYKIFKSFAIETGIKYSYYNFKKKTELDGLTFGDQYNVSGGALGTTSDKLKPLHIYHYQFIGIPLKISYLPGKHKVRFIASAGLEINYLVKSRTENHLDIPTEYDYGNYHKINFSPFVGAGIEWKLSKRICVDLEPSFTYNLIPLIKSTTTSNFNLWSAGFNIGCYFNL